jgi:hypothetical protein
MMSLPRLTVQFMPVMGLENIMMTVWLAGWLVGLVIKGFLERLRLLND